MAGVGGSDHSSTDEVAIRRKTAAQKDNNHLLRQQQIISYKTAMSKEARAQRSRLRHGSSAESSDRGSGDSGSEDASPKKKKRVNFNLQPICLRLPPGPSAHEKFPPKAVDEKGCEK